MMTIIFGMNVRRLTALCLALTMAAVSNAYAQVQTSADTVVPSSPVGEISSSPVQFRYPLSKFVPTPGPLVLRDASTGIDISVPISGRLKLDSITLTLTFTSSIALDPATSVLNVRFNEATLAQVRLDPLSPVATAQINLPVELARPGYNVISLDITQHNGQACENPEAPELWTEINTAKSSLEVNAEISDQPITLSEIDQIFSPGIGGARRLAIVVPALTKDANIIKAGGLVAQAVALRSEYEPVELRPAVLASAAEQAGGWVLDDQVLIGTPGQLEGFLVAGEAEKIVGPYLGLHSLDQRQIRLVVSGRSPQEILVAARALTYMDIPITDSSGALIRDIKRSPSLKTKAVQANQIYDFEELGLPTTTLKGSGTQNLTLTLPMPPDLYAPEQAALDVLLDLNYGAGIGPGSVINIELNGKFLHAVGLTNEAGAAFRGYRISVPLRDFVGGANQVAFNVVMRPVAGEPCAGVSGRHLAMTLFGTSSIQIPEASNVAAQPDLDLMARTGFPYSVASSSPTSVWMSDASLLGASWAFVARLAQVSGTPLPDLQFAIGGEPPRGQAILIGESRALPPRIFSKAVQSVGEVNRVPYLAFDGLEGRSAPGILEKLWPFGGAPHAAPEVAPSGVVEQVNDLGNNVVLTAVRSEAGDEGTVTVVTAATRERLESGIMQLVQPQYWGQARGDTMLWSLSPESVTALRLSPRFQSADASAMMGLRFYVSQNPWWWLGGTVLILMGLSGLTVWLLSRRRPPSA